MLVPLAAVLLYLNEGVPMPVAWRAVILFGIAVLICVLAVNWIERHPGLIERERPETHTYRVVSYPWFVFQHPSSATEDAGDSDYESTRHEEIPIRHVRPTVGD
jgi:hypothetical protein